MKSLDLSFLSFGLLEGVSGGLNFGDLAPSENVMHAPPPMLSEDGRMVGPYGEWSWDPSIGMSNRATIDYAPPMHDYPRPGGEQDYHDGTSEEWQSYEQAQKAFGESDAAKELSDYYGGVLNGTIQPDLSHLDMRPVEERSPPYPGQFIPSAQQQEFGLGDFQSNGGAPTPATSPFEGGGVDPTFGVDGNADSFVDQNNGGGPSVDEFAGGFPGDVGGIGDVDTGFA